MHYETSTARPDPGQTHVTRAAPRPSTSALLPVIAASVFNKVTAGGSRQLVEPRHYQHVTRLEGGIRYFYDIDSGELVEVVSDRA